MNFFQIISLTFLGFFLLNQLRFLKGKPLVKILYELRWIFITLIAVLIITFPNLSMVVGNFFGIKRGADFVLYASILWLLYKVYVESRRSDRIEKNLEDLVMELALKFDKDPKKDA